MGEMTDGLWTKEDVAAYLGVSVHSIYKMTAPKARLRIPHVRVGGIRFRKADIDRWLDLISVSNMDILEKARRKARTTTHGNHPQKKAP